MNDNSDDSLHLSAEEILATLAVLAVAGLFIWHQLGRGGNVTPRPAATAPAEISTLPAAGLEGAPLRMRHRAVLGVNGGAGAIRPAELDQGRSGGASGCASGKNPYRLSGIAPGSGECGVARPMVSERRNGGGAVADTDEVILGGSLEDGDGLAVAATAVAVAPSSSAGVSSAVIDSVNFNQAEDIISLSGKAPADYEKVQVIVNGERLDPAPLDAASNWRQQISAGDEDLYIQLAGVDSAGELVFDEETMPSVYVVSVPGPSDKQTGVAVMTGQLYQVISGETVTSLARDFAVSERMLDKVNGLSGRRLVEGEVLFIPFTSSSE